jgi:DNA ligase-1
MILNQVKKLVDELKATSSSLEKKEILKKYLVNDEDLKNIVYYTYNPFYQFYITSDVCEKNIHLSGKQFECIFELLDSLRLRKLTGHDAVGAVNAYIKNNEEYKEIVYTIIDKDLKTRTAEKTINSAIKNLIPEFEVALADKYDEKNVNFKDGWYVSRKIDGARCIAVVDNEGNTIFYSRKGKIFDTLDAVGGEIKALGVTNVVFDGELCLVNKEGNEDFQGIMKELRKKDHVIKNPSFKIFDMIDHDEFYSKKGKPNKPYSIRLKNLICVMKDITANSCLSVLEQEYIRDDRQFAEWVNKSTKNSWEGLILRADSPYKGKRSKDMLKWKTFHDAEYTVVDVEFGPFRYVLNGQEQEEDMLSCVTITHKGHSVRVGSGFSIEQRQHFYKNPKEILGKIIKVNYFEETKNQDGGISLRFPTLAYIYGDSRDI